MAMTLAKARSGIQAALRTADRSNIIKRGLSSSAGHDDEHETAKWEKITYAGIVSCTALATYILSKGHAHYDEPPDQMGFLRQSRTIDEECLL
ncbi:hypothetical protein V2J09_001885 [Rumex salicifolius]